MAEVENPTTPEKPKLSPRAQKPEISPRALRTIQAPGTPKSPRKRVASSMPQSSSPSVTKKHANDGDDGKGSRPKSSPSAQDSRTTRSRTHIRDLSPNGQAEREELVRKEMAELHYWHEHPDELRAQIRQTDPHYGMREKGWDPVEQQWYQDMLEEHEADAEP